MPLAGTQSTSALFKPCLDKKSLAKCSRRMMWCCPEASPPAQKDERAELLFFALYGTVWVRRDGPMQLFSGDTPLFLAPMAGVTDYAFRTVCAQHGADVTVTEMVSSRALVYQDRKSRGLLRRNEGSLCGAPPPGRSHLRAGRRRGGIYPRCTRPGQAAGGGAACTRGAGGAAGRHGPAGPGAAADPVAARGK